MSIKDIRQYAVWAQMGDSTLEQRYNLFLERREAVMALHATVAADEIANKRDDDKEARGCSMETGR